MGTQGPWLQEGKAVAPFSCFLPSFLYPLALGLPSRESVYTSRPGDRLQGGFDFTLGSTKF